MSRTKGSVNKVKIETPIEKPIVETPQPVKVQPVEKPIEKVEMVKPIISIEEKMKTKVEQIKEHLDKQAKVMFMIPKMPNESANATDQVCINGYKVEYPKGEMIEVPEQIAQMFVDKYKIQGSIVSRSLSSGRTISGQEVGERL